jgi:hypothetical protein
MALWALKSFYRCAEVDWPLVIHDGGGLTSDIQASLTNHFPNARIFGWDESNEAVEGLLNRQNWQAIIKTRRQLPMMRKIIDCSALAVTPNILLFDSDVLFFQKPAEVIAAGESDLQDLRFNRDYVYSYSITRDEAKRSFDYSIPELINAGLGVVPVSLVDFEFIDSVCASGRLPVDSYTEQTLYALLAGRFGYRYLSDQYIVSNNCPEFAIRNPVARHYVFPVRNLFFEEGIPYLLKATNMLAI